MAKCFGNGKLHHRLLASIFLLVAIGVSFSMPARALTTDLFVGGGMERSTLKLTTTSTVSNFVGWGGVFDIGGLVHFDESFGVLLSGEYGYTSFENSGNNKVFSETAKLETTGGKLGFVFNRFALGAGIKSLSLQVDGVTNVGQQDSVTYKGQLPFGFASFTIRAKDTFGATVEGQYGTTSIGEINLVETIGALRFYLYY